jgi:molybdate transport system regulatory protein
MARTLPEKIDTLIALRADGRLLVGRERITLLEAVAKHGSITKAAEAAGFSYKTAWDAVNAINNLLPRPAFVTKTGGTSGGGAAVTAEGLRLIAAFRRLEEKVGRISAAIAEEGLENADEILFWGMAVKVSARNAFHCKVTEVKAAPVNVEVKLALSPETTIYANVTNASVAELGLAPGRSVVALVNSSSVMVMPATDQPLKLSARNRIRGRVTARVDGGVTSEITIDIGGGKTISAVVTQEGAQDVPTEPGSDVFAIFKTSHVILAAD